MSLAKAAEATTFHKRVTMPRETTHDENMGAMKFAYRNSQSGEDFRLLLDALGLTKFAAEQAAGNNG